MTSRKKFLLIPLDFFQTSKVRKKSRKILGSPPPLPRQKTEKSQNILGGFAPWTLPRQKTENLKKFPEASPPDPPKKSKK